MCVCTCERARLEMWKRNIYSASRKFHTPLRPPPSLSITLSCVLCRNRQLYNLLYDFVCDFVDFTSFIFSPVQYRHHPLQPLCSVGWRKTQNHFSRTYRIDWSKRVRRTRSDYLAMAMWSVQLNLCTAPKVNHTQLSALFWFAAISLMPV